MTWKPEYVDMVILLVREDMPIGDIASVFSVSSETLYALLRSRGFQLDKLKKMSPLPQEERNKVIQNFCKHKVKVKRFRLLLDSHGGSFSDFTAQPLQIVFKHPKVLRHYADFVCLLIREGIKSCDVASVLSVDQKKVAYLLRTCGFKVAELKNMPPLPQEERRKIIQKFCSDPSKEQKLRLLLDSYGTCLEDFVERPPQNKSFNVLRYCADFVFLLIREGIRAYEVASFFAVDPKTLTDLGKLHGHKLTELKHMPPLPQDERQKIIQDFCKKPLNEEKLRSLLDAHSVRFEDFVTQPFRKFYGHINCKHANNAYMSGARILSDRDKEIAELRRNGKTLAAIAQKYGISRKRVRQIILRYNRISDSPIDIKTINRITLLPTPKQLEHRKKILELCRAGLTYSQIAEALGISKAYAANTIYKYNRTAEHPLNVRKEKNKQGMCDEKKQGIITERKKGKTIHLIAEQFGVSPASVNKLIKKAGLTRPRRSPKK